MMRLSLKFEFSRNQIEEALVDGTRPIMQAATEEVGRKGIDYVIEEANGDFNVGASNRHRPLASIGDPGQYEYVVRPLVRGYKVTWKVKGGDAFKAKFNSLNYGSSWHVIEPGRAPRVAEDSLHGNATASVLSFRGQTVNQRPDTHPTRYPVIHPGTAGTGFWERGLQRAYDELPNLLR